MAKRTLTVEITGDVDGARRAFRQLEDDAGRSGDGVVATFRGKLGGLKGIGSDILGGLIGGGVVAGFTSLQPAIAGVVDEYTESVRVGRETERVIRTTGGAAGVTANQVSDLAEALSNKRGIDDELIQSGANLMLTFTNVRNEAGKGNDIFTQSVKLSGDMSAALGVSLPGATKMLGKALNDPIKGMTALGRAGVQFSDQQKEQIKTMVESGNILGAQKLILDTVKTKFEGAAEAAATPIDKIKTRFKNLQEDIGKFAVEDALPWLQEMWPKVEQAFSQGIARVKAIIEPFVQILTQLWSQFGDNILNFIRPVWENIQTIIGGALNVIEGIVKFVLAVIQGDWGAAWDAIQQVFSGVWDIIKGIVSNAIEYVKLVIGVAWETITQVWDAAWNGIKDLFSGIWDGIKAVVDGAIGFVKDIIQTQIDAITDIWQTAWDTVSDAVSTVWDTIKTVVSGGIDEVVGFISGLPGKIVGFVGDLLAAGTQLGSAIIDGIKGGITGAAQAIADVATAVFDAFKSGWNTVAKAINDFIPNEVGFDTPVGFIGVDLPDNPIPTFHKGGVVPGRPGQEVLALLQAGEQVIPANQVGAGGGVTIQFNAPVYGVNDLEAAIAAGIARANRDTRRMAAARGR